MNEIINNSCVCKAAPGFATSAKKNNMPHMQPIQNTTKVLGCLLLEWLQCLTTRELNCLWAIDRFRFVAGCLMFKLDCSNILKWVCLLGTAEENTKHANNFAWRCSRRKQIGKTYLSL